MPTCLTCQHSSRYGYRLVCWINSYDNGLSFVDDDEEACINYWDEEMEVEDE